MQIFPDAVAECQDGGLRERKKRRTRRAIADAALDLFDRQGYQATTIAQIAEAADVSPRTVSAYFPAKEELAFADYADWAVRLERRLGDRPDGQTAPETLRDWIIEMLPELVEREAQITVRRRLVASDPALRAYQDGAIARSRRLLQAAIADDLGAAPDALEARMAAAATSAMLEVLDRHGQEEARDDADLSRRRVEALERLDRAVAFVAAGIRALQESDRGTSA
ncbi:MAG: TetR/AcrR family transcriptional regulator [Thermoleophilia bacterium]